MRTIRILSLSVALLGAACGAPSEPAGRSPSSPATGSTAAGEPTATSGPSVATPAPAEPIDPRDQGFDVGFGEWAISLEAPAIRPGPVTLVVRNGGTMLHGFEIKSEDGDGDDRFKFETDTFRAGEVVRVQLDLPPGLYELECFVADHDERGMKTWLEVRPDAPLVEPRPTAAGSVAIEGFAFAPDLVEVDAGTEVTWTNDDPAPHTVSALDGSFDSGTLQPGQTFTATLEQPGEIAYRCDIHPTMEGSVKVVA